MKSVVRFFALLLLATSISGCATTVGVNVERPAELDLNGATSISIIPFTYERSSRSFRRDKKIEELAIYTTSELEKKILYSEYLTLVDSKDLAYTLRHNLEPACDVYIKGHIKDYQERILEDKRKVISKDSDGNEITKYVTDYKLKIKFSIYYKIIDAETREIIYSTTENYEKSSSEYKDPRDLPSASSLAKSSITSYSSKLMKKIAPYTVHREISMMKDKSKNTNMKLANEFVKDGQINIAKEEYLKVYNQTGLLEAGYNAARLLEAQGNYEEAEKIMFEIYQKTANKKAFNTLNDIRYEIRAAKKLQAQLEQREERQNADAVLGTIPDELKEK